MALRVARFIALALADAMSTRWPVLTCTRLFGVTRMVALAARAVHGADAIWPRQAQAAFVYIAVPTAFVQFGALVVSAAGLVSRRE